MAYVAKKNIPKPQRDPVPHTGYELLHMTATELRNLIFGPGGGRVARPGIREIVDRKIAEYRNS